MTEQEALKKALNDISENFGMNHPAPRCECSCCVRLRRAVEAARVLLFCGVEDYEKYAEEHLLLEK